MVIMVLLIMSYYHLFRYSQIIWNIAIAILLNILTSVKYSHF